jgi:TP901 family phage tail tape measure protein
VSKPVRLVFLADDSQLNSALRRLVGQTTATQAALKKLQKVGADMTRVGRSMTLGVTLPAAVAGAASVKMAADFETSMTHIETLVGQSRTQVSQWSKDILALAPLVGKSPKELADALYYITSSGAKASDALAILTVSAKASAVGLGDTQTIADGVTSVLNAYGSKTISAAKATDILIRAVAVGKGEPTEFAKNLGQVLPIAAELGVNFADVASAMAHITLKGDSASEAVTKVRGALVKLMKPTIQGRALLAGIGMSTGDIKKSIKDKGLLPTLQMLHDKIKAFSALGSGAKIKLFDGKSMKDLTAIQRRLVNNDFSANLGTLFNDVRGFQGVLSLVGESKGKVDKLFATVHGAGGDLDKAFGRTAETAAQKFKKAFAGMQVSAVKLGNTLMPFATAVVKKIGEWIDKFVKLNPEAQKTILAVIGLAAALGPLLWGLGSLTKTFATLARHPILTALALLAGLFVTLYTRNESFRKGVAEVGGVLKDAGQWVNAHRTAIKNLAITFGTFLVVGRVSSIITAFRHLAAIVGVRSLSALMSVVRIGPMFTAALGAIRGAWAAFQASFLASPAGVIVAALAALFIGFKLFSDYVERKHAPVKADIDQLTTSIKEFAATGRVTGELAAKYGSSLETIGRAVSGVTQGMADLKKMQELTAAGLSDPSLGANWEPVDPQQVQQIKDLDTALTQLVKSGGASQAQIFLQELAGSGRVTATQFQQLIGMLPDYTKATKDASTANTGLASGFGSAAANAKTMAGHLEDAVTAGRTLTDVWNQLNGAVVGSDRAMLSANQAIGAVKDSFTENGKAITGNSSAALKNRVAVGEAAKAAADAADAKLKETGSVDAANKVYTGYIGQLRKTLTQSGLTKKQVDELLGDYGKMPKSIQTDITAKGDETTQIKLRALNIMQNALKKGQSISTSAARALAGDEKAAKDRGLFAAGGWTGPGSKYQPAGLVHADEFVIQKESRQRIERANPGALDYMNRQGRIPGYARGGIVVPIDVNTAMTKIPSKSDALGKVGGALGGGKGAGGWRWQEAVLRAAFGNRVSFTSTTGGGHAKGSWHYKGRALDSVGPSMMAIFNWIKSHFGKTSKELIYSPAGTGIKNGKLVDILKFYGRAVYGQHFNHVHWAYAKGGRVGKLYDNGGVLPHGGVAVNRSGKPEAILTNAESRGLKAMLHAGKADRTQTNFGRYVRQSLLDGLTGTETAIKGAAKRVANYVGDVFTGRGNRRGRTYLTRLLKADTADLVHIVRGRANVAKRLKTAQDNLQKLTDDRTNITADIAGKVRDSGALMGHGASLASALKRMQRAVTNAKEFGDDISILRKRGMSADLLRQLGEAGPVDGMAMARKLMTATKSQINSLNTLNGQLGSTATKTGQTVGSSLYDSGIQAAKGLVAGLQRSRTRRSRPQWCASPSTCRTR